MPHTLDSVQMNSYAPETGAVVLPMQNSAVSPAWAESVLQHCPLILVADGVSALEEAALAHLEAIGCTVLRHSEQLGIGRCMKSAIHHYLARYPQGKGVVICGRETGFDLENLSTMLAALDEHPSSMTLAAAPPQKDTAIGMRAESWICRQLFAVVCGKRLLDVRAPLRSLPRALLERAAVLTGEGEDYMTNLLLILCRNTIPVYEVPAVRSAPVAPIPPVMWGKLLMVILSFLLSSLTSGIIDYAVFIFMNTQVTPVLLTCQVTARIISSVVNFTLNRKLVFAPRSRGKRTLAAMLVKYYLLVAFSLAVSTALLYLFSRFIGIPAIWAKPMVELIMYFINFFVQRDVVFRTRKKSQTA